MKKFLKNFFTFKPQRDYTLTTKRVKLSALAIILTQTLDYITTWYGLTYTTANESNPLMQTAVTHSMLTFFIVKTIGTILLVYLTWRRRYAPLVASIFYAVVVLNNIYVIILS